MGDVAIRVEHLGKQYRLGGQQLRYATFRETLVNTARAPLGWLKGERRAQQTSFWALDDVSFEVKHGEAVGIIGRNGAGKSTLLKILSRITSPTRGRVDIYGRVGSLLEVGTGFHPELTGRENIFLNGAILGMTRLEIMRKFDEIVAFAEIEKFLDTAVKFYSSGMYVRLAFAVAAHLEPEILVVDEVLAVGDAEFQKKCLGKMGDVAHEGRTVLFVSHNLTAIQTLCFRSILLMNGAIAEDGETNKVVTKYLILNHDNKLEPIDSRKDRTGNGKLRFTGCEIISEKKQIPQTGKKVIFKIYYHISQDSIPLKNVAFSISINTFTGNHVLVFFTEETRKNIPFIFKDGSIECIVPELPIAGGTYGINLYSTVNGILADYVIDASTIVVDDSSYFPDGGSKHPDHPLYITKHMWSLEN
jgi:lipopolysaccharide transport system ATP-binding protein